MHIHIDTDFSLLPPYGLMIGLSFLAGAAGMYLLNCRRGIQKLVSRYLLLLLPLMSIFCGMGLTFITSGGQSNGLSSIGGLIGVYAAVMTMGLISPVKGDLRKMAETATVMLPLMYSVSKIGCFLAGCCHGFPYEGILAVEYIGQNALDGAVFPVQAAETLVFLGVFLFGLRLYLRQKRYAVQTVFITCALAKFALDFLRASHIGVTLSLTQILCLALALIGTIWRRQCRIHNSNA